MQLFSPTIIFMSCMLIFTHEVDAATSKKRLHRECPILSDSQERCVRNPYLIPQVLRFTEDLLCDVAKLHKNLITWDSFKIISTMFPFFIATRMIDEKIQNCFYNACCHKNICQMPHWCKDIAKYSLAVPITLFGLEALFSSDDDLRTTGRVFLIGMPFVIFGKDLIKRAKFDACLRPWNQYFSCKKRAHGGFPSGHMAEASYIAILYGLRYGPKYAIPLGLMATFLGAAFLNCNRHYTSQLIAGVGLGAMYAVAANRLIDEKLEESLHLTVACDRNGSPCINVSYDF